MTRGRRDRELEALAPHRLDQDAELQFAAAGNLEGIPALGLGDADRDIALGLAQQPRADHAAGHLVAFAAGERRIVDREGHGERRRIDRIGRDRPRHQGIADRVGNRRIAEPRDRHDVAGLGAFDRHALEAAEGEQLGQARRLAHLARRAHRFDRHVDAGLAGMDAPGQHAADIGIVFQRRHQHGERIARVAFRRRHMRHDQVEQRIHVLLRILLEIAYRPALLGGGENHRKIELRIGRADRREQVEDLVVHLMRACIGPVDLVDHHDRPEPVRQRLHGHELGLRHRAFGGIDQQQHAIDHGQDALDLAAEIGMAGRIDDVEPVALPLRPRCISPEW